MNANLKLKRWTEPKLCVMNSMRMTFDRSKIDPISVIPYRTMNEFVLFIWVFYFSFSFLFIFFLASCVCVTLSPPNQLCALFASQSAKSMQRHSCWPPNEMKWKKQRKKIIKNVKLSKHTTQMGFNWRLIITIELWISVRQFGFFDSAPPTECGVTRNITEINSLFIAASPRVTFDSIESTKARNHQRQYRSRYRVERHHANTIARYTFSDQIHNRYKIQYTQYSTVQHTAQRSKQ